jgi:hypothetical protein
VLIWYCVCHDFAIHEIPKLILPPRLTMADGVFTPAVSVTSAVGGIGNAKPSVTKDTTPISIVSKIIPPYKMVLIISYLSGVFAGGFLRAAIWNSKDFVHFRSE